VADDAPTAVPTAVPPNVAASVAEPAAVGAVSVAVYVPLPLSVVEPSVPVPDDFEITTVAPPVVKLVLFTSRACTVIVEVLDPSAVIEVGLALIVECAALAAPATYVTVAWV
jgi:hypothetical protein